MIDRWRRQENSQRAFRSHRSIDRKTQDTLINTGEWETFDGK